LQVVTFVAGCEGVGRSVAVANIGVALARLGKEVLIIDEHAPGDDVASTFGLVGRSDLLNVVQRELPLSQVLLQPMHGLRVLPAARAVKKLGRLSLPQQQTLLDAMSGLERPIDVILVDASMAHPNGFSPFGLASQEAVVVLSGKQCVDYRGLFADQEGQSCLFAQAFPDSGQQGAQPAGCQVDFRKYRPGCRAARHCPPRLRWSHSLDEALRQSSQLVRPVLVQAPDSPSAVAFRDIASDMLYWQRSESESGGVEQFMQQLLHLSQRITPNVLRA
jgi:flagellar biosynthesis protein FlhG